MDTPQSINSAQLEEFKQDNLGGSNEMYASILSIFLSDAPKMISEIQKFISEGQPLEAKGPAHNLKSNSAALGAMTLSALAKELEGAARNENVTEISIVADKIVSEFEIIRPFFESELQKANS